MNSYWAIRILIMLNHCGIIPPRQPNQEKKDPPRRIILFHSYDGNTYHTHEDSNIGHVYTTLAKLTNGSPFAVSGYHGYTDGFYHKRAETFDFSTKTWTEVDDYPYGNL